MGYLIAIVNCLALLAYGASEGILAKTLSATCGNIGSIDIEMDDFATAGPPSEAQKFAMARHLFVHAIDINCQRVGDPNILSFIHITLIFMVHLSHFPATMGLISNYFPWTQLILMLNGLIQFYHTYPRIESDNTPIPEKNDARPTPEEFALRGLDFAESYFPEDWFKNPNIDDENMYKEDPSMNMDYCPECILWLGRQLAKQCQEITYDSAKHEFIQAVSTKSDSPVPSESEVDTMENL